MLPVIRAKREHAVKTRRSQRTDFALFCSLLPFWLLSLRPLNPKRKICTDFIDLRFLRSDHKVSLTQDIQTAHHSQE